MQQVRRLRDTLPTDAVVVHSATDGEKLTEDQIDCYRRNLLNPTYPFRLQPAEVAAFLSHRSCWQAFLDTEMDAALIVEDDAELCETDFAAAFALGKAHIEQGDLIRFPLKLREKEKHIVAKGTHSRLMTTHSVGLGMVAYIVTRDGARKLLASTKNFDRPVDTYLQLSWHHKLRILTVWPSGVSEISKDLGGSLIHARKGLKEKAHKEVLRPIYRTKLFAHRIFRTS